MADTFCELNKYQLVSWDEVLRKIIENQNFIPLQPIFD